MRRKYRNARRTRYMRVARENVSLVIPLRRRAGASRSFTRPSVGIASRRTLSQRWPVVAIVRRERRSNRAIHPALREQLALVRLDPPSTALAEVPLALLDGSPAPLDLPEALLGRPPGEHDFATGERVHPRSVGRRGQLELIARHARG